MQEGPKIIPPRTSPITVGWPNLRKTFPTSLETRMTKANVKMLGSKICIQKHFLISLFLSPASKSSSLNYTRSCRRQRVSAQKIENKFETLSVEDLVSNITADDDKYLRFNPLVEKIPELSNDLNLNWLNNLKSRWSISTVLGYLG